MWIDHGQNTPITKSAVIAIISFFLIGVVCLFLLFIFVKRFPSLMPMMQSEGGYEIYYYRDADGDGRGNPEDKISMNSGDTPPQGYTVIVGDCDDHDPKK